MRVLVAVLVAVLALIGALYRRSVHVLVREVEDHLDRVARP